MTGLSSSWTTFLIFLRLGTVCFGGPIAHISYFRDEFVERRRWIEESTYADMVALCQFLPGPASSQVAMLLGLTRAGASGAFAAWAGFTLPSAALLFAFWLGVSQLGGVAAAPALHGLKIVAVAVVAFAVWSMARSLSPDRERATVAVCGAAFVLLFPSIASQIAALIGGAIYGSWRLSGAAGVDASSLPASATPRRGAVLCLAAYALLLFGLPLLGAASGSLTLAEIAIFYRSGALVFGGGHVVLPLLQQSLVPQGFLDNDSFLAGYGAAQAVPGPLFAFAAYLGAAIKGPLAGGAGAVLCLVAIYLPSFLLLFGILPFWESLRRKSAMRSALMGVNAAVVGLLLAALYTPVWTSAIFSPLDFALALSAFLLLAFWKAPPWIVVGLGAAAASAFAPFQS